MFLDIRTYDKFSKCHLKNSKHMGSVDELFDTYQEFLALYQFHYPENIIVLIGDRETDPSVFGNMLLTHTDVQPPIGRLCMIRGGIDAIALEYPSLLRIAKKEAKEEDFIVQYEKFIKKAKLHKNNQK